MTETVRVLSAKVDFTEEDLLELSEVGRRKIEKSFRGMILKVDSPASENLCDALSDLSGWLVSRANYKSL
jgi:hypothetical protein